MPESYTHRFQHLTKILAQSRSLPTRYLARKRSVAARERNRVGKARALPTLRRVGVVDRRAVPAALALLPIALAQTPGDRAGLAVADSPAVDGGDRNDAARGRRQEHLVGRADRIRRQRLRRGAEVGLAAELQDRPPGDA